MNFNENFSPVNVLAPLEKGAQYSTSITDIKRDPSNPKIYTAHAKLSNKSSCEIRLEDRGNEFYCGVESYNRSKKEVSASSAKALNKLLKSHGKTNTCTNITDIKTSSTSQNLYFAKAIFSNESTGVIKVDYVETLTCNVELLKYNRSNSEVLNDIRPKILNAFNELGINPNNVTLTITNQTSDTNYFFYYVQLSVQGHDQTGNFLVQYDALGFNEPTIKVLNN